MERVQEFTTHPFGEFTEHKPFIGLVQKAPFRALSLLSLEARHQRYPTHLWRDALSYWPDETSGRLLRLFMSRLVHLPPEEVLELRYYAPNWMSKNLPKLAKVSQAHALACWDAMLDVLFALGAEAFSSSSGDIFIEGQPQLRSRRTYEHSINSPMGHLLDALFDILNALKLKKGSGLPPDFRSRVERSLSAPGEGTDHAVCETTLRLAWLHYLDPDWVRARIIPLLDPDRHSAEPAWNGFLHNTQMPGPELFSLLKSHFLRVFPKAALWRWNDEAIKRLNEFLVVGCYWNLKSGQYVSYAEARAALQQATDEGRSQAIWLLTRIISDQGDWKKFGKPFIQKAWPRERRFQTASSSQNFARLAEEAGDHFPDVVKTILPLLGPVDHVDLLIYRAKTKHDEEETQASFGISETDAGTARSPDTGRATIGTIRSTLCPDDDRGCGPFAATRSAMAATGCNRWLTGAEAIPEVLNQAANEWNSRCRLHGALR